MRNPTRYPKPKLNLILTLTLKPSLNLQHSLKLWGPAKIPSQQWYCNKICPRKEIKTYAHTHTQTDKKCVQQQLCLLWFPTPRVCRSSLKEHMSSDPRHCAVWNCPCFFLMLSSCLHPSFISGMGWKQDTSNKKIHKKKKKQLKKDTNLTSSVCIQPWISHHQNGFQDIYSEWRIDSGCSN